MGASLQIMRGLYSKERCAKGLNSRTFDQQIQSAGAILVSASASKFQIDRFFGRGVTDAQLFIASLIGRQQGQSFRLG